MKLKIKYLGQNLGHYSGLDSGLDSVHYLEYNSELISGLDSGEKLEHGLAKD